MNSQRWHNITPRGSLTSGFRAVQEEARYSRVARSAGMLLKRTPRGTFITPLNRRSTNNDGGSVIPRWG